MNQTDLDPGSVFRALADPGRLRAWQLLAQEELTVGELAEILGSSPSTTSGMLKVLRESGVVGARPDGRRVWYAAAPAPFWLEEALRNSPLAPADLQALRRVCAAREESFPAEDPRYQPGRSWEGLARGLLAASPPGVVADLGVGGGELSLLLAASALRLYAVDRSEALLLALKSRCKERGIDNLIPVEAEIAELQLPEPVDQVILSQTLHHLPDPDAALAAAFRLLRPGGSLLLWELGLHGQDLGFPWPGFSHDTLYQCITKIGFIQVEVMDVGKDRRQLPILFARGIKP